ncbi:MAG: hypothetical protein IGR93_01535 [Hydrococcus sp. C42_A2020_068]|nr:hypothetical protein [Hydrococcus sp. C42_A2020_068]
MEDVETSRSKGGFEVLHAVANRVRLRAVDAKAKAELNNVAQHLRQQNGVRSVSANEQIGSLSVTFEPNKQSLSQLKEVLQPFRVSQAQTGSENFPDEALSQAFTGLRSLVPPVVGLMTTRRLGMYGWQAIATYLIATNLTREAIEGFDLQLPAKDREKSSSAYKIIHQIPGRIRLHIPRIAWDRNYVGQLDRIAAADKRIKSLRVNPATATVVIDYRADTSFDASAFLSQIRFARRQNPTASVEEKSDDRSFEHSKIDESPESIPTPEATEAIASTASISEPPKAATLETTSPWSQFKFSALALMLQSMANMPLKPALVFI